MSYNGSGTFQINTSGQPVVTGTVISSSAFNSLTADLATGLSTAITKDGQTATTVRIPFAQGINSTLVTDSTSTSTGSIITTGGIGIAKALYVGTTANIADSINTPNTFGYKNRIINGAMQIAQRNTTGTSGSSAPTTSPTYPSLDRFYAYATGATVTVARVTGSNAIKNNLQVTGAGSVTAVGIGQRIEQLNSYDLAGSTATLSVNISNSLLTTVTWTASYATSADTWSAKTQIATGTFTVTSTLTNYNAQISIPAAATTGIEILFTVGAQTSGTWVIGNVQFEKGSTATSFDYRPYGTELALCQRYYEKSYDQSIVPGTSTDNTIGGVGGYFGTTVLYGNVLYKVVKRIITNTVTIYAYDGTSGSVTLYNAAGNSGSTGCIALKIGDAGFTGIVSSGGTAFIVSAIYWYQWTSSAEL